jgi:hypothetical protein
VLCIWILELIDLLFGRFLEGIPAGLYEQRSYLCDSIAGASPPCPKSLIMTSPRETIICRLHVGSWTDRFAD